MIEQKYITRANEVAAQVPAILENRGLEPIIKRFLLTQRSGQAWLFAELDRGRIQKIERYTHPEVTHQISTALGGLPVVVSNSTGLRYGVLLSPRPTLPTSIEFDGWAKGLVKIGVSKKAGQISATWPDFGNAVIAGMTRSGKSNTLRLIVGQALAEGHQAIIVDPDSSTFPNLRGHPQVLEYADSPDLATQAIEAATKAHQARVRLYAGAKDSGKVPQLPRVVVVIDEYNGLVMANGGPRGIFAQAATALAYGGLKWGIHLIIAGHEFSRDLIGPITGQMVTRLCFAVRARAVSQVVVGRAGAEKITHPGRALASPWGWVQVYQMGYEDFENQLSRTLGQGISDREQRLVELIKENGGRITFEILESKAGLTRSQAKRLRSDWLARGIARLAPEANNSMVLMDWVL